MAIKEEMQSTLFLKDQATKEAFIKNSSDYSIIHLSTHASSGDFSTSANIEFYKNTIVFKRAIQPQSKHKPCRF